MQPVPSHCSKVRGEIGKNVNYFLCYFVVIMFLYVDEKIVSASHELKIQAISLSIHGIALPDWDWQGVGGGQQLWMGAPTKPWGGM